MEKKAVKIPSLFNNEHFRNVQHETSSPFVEKSLIDYIFDKYETELKTALETAKLPFEEVIISFNTLNYNFLIKVFIPDMPYKLGDIFEIQTANIVQGIRETISTMQHFKTAEPQPTAQTEPQPENERANERANKRANKDCTNCLDFNKLNNECAECNPLKNDFNKWKPATEPTAEQHTTPTPEPKQISLKYAIKQAEQPKTDTTDTPEPLYFEHDTEPAPIDVIDTDTHDTPKPRKSKKVK